jgi:hypothetical protein
MRLRSGNPELAAWKELAIFLDCRDLHGDNRFSAHFDSLE